MGRTSLVRRFRRASPRWMGGRWPRWPRWWRLSAQQLLELVQRAIESVRFGGRKIIENHCQPLTDEGADGPEGLLALGGESERLSPPVVRRASALDKSHVFEGRQELRDSWRRHGGLAGQLNADDISFRYRLKGQVLREGQGRIVRCDETLYEPAHQWSDAPERVGRVLAAV